MTQKVILLELVNRMYCLLVCSTSSFNHVPYIHIILTHIHIHMHTQRVQTPRGIGFDVHVGHEVVMCFVSSFVVYCSHLSNILSDT